MMFFRYSSSFCENRKQQGQEDGNFRESERTTNLLLWLFGLKAVLGLVGLRLIFAHLLLWSRKVVYDLVIHSRNEDRFATSLWSLWLTLILCCGHATLPLELFQWSLGRYKSCLVWLSIVCDPIENSLGWINLAFIVNLLVILLCSLNFKYFRKKDLV